MISKNTPNVLLFLAAALSFALMGWEVITALGGNSPVVFTAMTQESKALLIFELIVLAIGVVGCLVWSAWLLWYDRRSRNTRR